MDLVQDLLDDVRLSNGRFGSLAVIRANTSLMSASGGKAVTQKQFSRSPWLNVRFHQ